MLTKKKKIGAALAALSMIALVACDDDEIKYPSNYNDKILNDSLTDKEPTDGKTAQDTLKQYYQSLTNDDAVYEKTLNKVLTILSDNVHEFDASAQKGSKTYSVVNDTIDNKSVADGYSADAYKVSDNLLTRAKDSMFSTARGGSYQDDNMWDEAKYAKYLEQNYYYLTREGSTWAGDVTISKDESKLKNQLVTPEMTYDDAYSSVNGTAYEKYMSTELYDDMKINYLTTEYIMNKTYASIGNTNARKVQVISIVDRSDETGDAKKVLDAYVEYYILRKHDTDTTKYVDDDFSVLSKLWKGITVEVLADIIGDITITDSGDKFTYKISDPTEADEIKKFYSRYLVTLNDDNTITFGAKSPVLNYEQTKWLNGVTDKKDTLAGKILVDKEKIEEGDTNWHKIDSSLESTYTGSYTYDLQTGYRNAIDEIATRNLITEGTYLKSSGISSLPTGLTDRIFSSKVTSSKTSVDKMKGDNIDSETGLSKTKEDLTIYAKDGYRYMTVADTLSTDDASSILYYDSSSKTYYITRILDVVDTNATSLSSTDSIYDSEAKKAQIAREVAYAMSTTGSYKTDSAVYWLSRIDFTYSDEDFLEYMKSNYKDVFKTENPYSSEAKIKLDKLIVE